VKTLREKKDNSSSFRVHKTLAKVPVSSEGTREVRFWIQTPNLLVGATIAWNKENWHT
jgi:hypothetical protein